MKNKTDLRKKIIAIATVAALAVALILGGTFAMQDFNQHKTNNLDTHQKNMDVTLKEIFEPVDNWQEGQSAPKAVSVVNVGEADNAQPVYVRLMLSEYLDIYHVNYVYKMDPETADPSDTTKNLPYRFMTDEDGKFITFLTREDAQDFLRDDLGIDETIPQLDARIVRVDEEPYLKNSDGNGNFYIKTQFGDVNGQYGKYLVIGVAPDGDHSDFGYPGVEVVAGNEYWAQKPNRDEGKSMFAKSTASDWERDHFDLYDADAPARDYVTIDWEDMILLADWVDSGAAPVAMWIYDPVGGYFYWGEPLDPKIETGPLMSGVTLVQRPEGSLFYSLRVDMETVLRDQLMDLETQSPIPPEIWEAWSYLEVSPELWELDASAATKNITVTASGTWTVVSSGEPWLDFQPSGSTGNGTLKLTVEENGETGYRSAIITVICGKVSREIEVIQEPADTTGLFNSGTGTVSDPYEIFTPKQLENLAMVVNEEWTEDDSTPYTEEYYYLGHDIDLSDYSTGNGWVQIGTYTVGGPGVSSTYQPFSGTFDGKGKVITGLYMNYPTASNASNPGKLTRFGLFGEVSSATIKNVGIVDVDITAPMKTGGLAAQILDSTVTNCYVTGKIVGTNSSYSEFGGLLGYISNCTVSNCYADVKVNSAGSNIGGLIGSTADNNTVENCFATGDVSSSNSFYENVGGLVGYINDNCEVKNCYTTGNVSGTGQIGGIVGQINNISPTKSNISNCYATGAISGQNRVGGIVGYVSNYDYDIVVQDCAALNSSVIALGGTDVGRVVGWYWWNNLDNNVAWDAMDTNGGAWKYLDDMDGEDITATAIRADGTIGSRFNAPAWTTALGKLPGLFGQTVALPTWLQ